MSQPSGLSYRVNRLDQIVFVSQGWDAFADANGGVKARADRVLNRPLQLFVSDLTTRHLYDQILLRARSGHAAAFTFRCDSPDERRLLEMRVTPLEDGEVLFATTTLSTERRPHVWLFDIAAQRAHELVRVCGWCKKVHDGSGWSEVEEALRRLRLLEALPVPRLTHGICETCFQSVRATLA